MDAGLLSGFFGRVLILAPFGGTVGAIAFVVAAFILRRLEAGGYPVEGGKAGPAVGGGGGPVDWSRLRNASDAVR